MYGHFELELGAHFKLELGGQYSWNLQFNKGGEKEAKESYANKFINKVTLLRNLLSSANPIIKFSYNLPGKSAEYIENSNLLKLTYKSFENNLSLFFDLVHEGVHSFDFNKNRMFVDYILGDLTTQSRNILESRAWGVQVYFGDTRPHTINQAKKYKDNTFNNQSKKYNVEKWDIGKFFRIK